MQLNDFLKQARLAAKLSQSQVAKQLGYFTPQFISNWERGQSNPPVSQLKRIAALYKIAPDGLFEQVLAEVVRHTKQEMERKFFGSKKRSAGA